MDFIIYGQDKLIFENYLYCPVFGISKCLKWRIIRTIKKTGKTPVFFRCFLHAVWYNIIQTDNAAC